MIKVSRMTRVGCHIITAAWLATVAQAAELAPRRIAVDLGNPGPAISPLLFSFNLEHTRYAMWKGLSAQLLANRKFAGPNVADGWKQFKVVRGVEGDDGVVARWYGIGKPAAQFSADTKACYAGKQSQRIRIAARGATGGLGQDEIPLQAGTPYTAQFQLKAEASLKVVARLCDASGHKQYASQSLALEQGDWRAWTLHFQAPQTDLHAKLEVAFEGPGTLWLGSASLLPADHFHGMRRDVIARLKEISVPMLRWPGGNFTRDYRWKEGLLPLDKRPPIASGWHETLPFTDNYDFHELGIDEYIALCRELGARPSITLTMGIAEGAREAADWVEYCNGSAQTRWGRVRVERGYKEPYHVQHWTIGNEVWGEWMGPAFYSLERYAAEVKQYAAAMRKVDPSLVLIASGVGAGWDKKLLEQAGTPFDWLSRHEYCKPVTQALSGAAGAQEYARQARRPREVVLPWLKEAREALDRAGGKRVGIAFDEWNLWHDWFVDPFKNEWHVGPIDAVFAAALLNVLCREAGNLNVPMAAMFQPINEGAIRVEPFSARLTAMGQVFALYRAHQGGRLLNVGPQGDRAVDACASLSADGKLLSVTLMNRAAAEECPVELALAGGTAGTATATILSVNELQPDQAMDRQSRQIPLGGDGKVSLVLPRFGIGLVRIVLTDISRKHGMAILEVGPLLAAAPDRDRFVCLDGIHMAEPYHRLMGAIHQGPAPAAPQPAAEGLEAPQEQQFTAGYDGSVQKYVLLLPKKFDPKVEHDLLIGFHGHGSDRGQYATQSRGECKGARDVAASHNMILISPDYRAPAGWMGIAAEADTLQMLGELKQRYKVRKVFLTGGSMGGAAVLTFAALHPGLVDGVSSQNGVANLLEYSVDLRYVLSVQTAIKDAFGGRSDETPAQFKKRNPAAYKSRSVEFHSEKFTMPLAVTVGDQDRLVPPESVLRLARAVKKHNPNVLVIERPNGGHETNYADTVAALEFVIEAAQKGKLIERLKAGDRGGAGPGR